MASRKRCPSLLGGLLWTAIGVLFLLRNLGLALDIWHLLGRYWPILLILLGLGKVIEYYRHTEGVSLRVGEVFGILLLLIVGAALTRIHDSPVRDWIWTAPVRIGSSEVGLGTSYSYTDEASFPVSPDTALRIENAYGAVNVTPGSEREVTVRLRKSVFIDDEAKAKQIAARIKIEGRPEGGAEASALTIATNREQLASEDIRFNTDMEVLVPKKVRLKITNSFGEVSVANLEGSLEIATTQRSVDVREFLGNVTVSNRYGDSRFAGITGNLAVDARGRVEAEGIQGKVDIRNEFSPVSVVRASGPVTVSNTEGSITVDEAAGAVSIDARGSQVTARNLKGALTVTASHRGVRISGVEAGVTLTSRYAQVNLREVRGDVRIDSSSDRLICEEIGGALRVKAKGSSVRAGTVQGPVEIESTLRDITVDDFAAACTVANEYARVRLTAAAVPKGDVSVRNRNGDIELSLPPESSFEIDAATRNGRIDSEFPSLKPAAGPGDSVTLKGAIRSGGPRIVLRTEYGNIRLGIGTKTRPERGVV
jgi:DUF4097 and DUF4098 domain-containing protein YvlB